MYFQVFKQYSAYLNLKLGCYICIWISCIDLLIRNGMIVRSVGSIVLIDILYYASILLLYASFSILIYVWTSSYIKSCQKPTSWINGIRIVLISLNIAFWVALYIDNIVGSNNFSPTIAVIMMATGWIEFLVLALKLGMVAKNEADLGVVPGGTAAQKISSSTYWICFTIFIVGIVFLFIHLNGFGTFTTVYFIFQYSIYFLIEVAMMVVVMAILHQKPSSQISQNIPLSQRKSRASTTTNV